MFCVTQARLGLPERGQLGGAHRVQPDSSAKADFTENMTALTRCHDADHALQKVASVNIMVPV